MKNPDTTLELSADEMRRLVEQAMAYIVPHIESLPRQPAVNIDDGRAVARRFVEPLPEKGRPFHELLELLFQRAIPTSFNTAGPGYLAYIPGGGLFHSAVAELITGAVNRYMGIWLAAPGLAQLEATVLRWFCDIVGYPSSAKGLLTTGGSLANFSAVVTARRERLPENFLAGTIYVSDQTHHSVRKAALLAGFPPENVRAIPSDRHFRIRPDLLRQQIIEDRDSERLPFMIVGNAGTTNTGAIDDLPALAEVAHHGRLWFHVDAAYGGCFLLTDYGRAVMKGIEQADSITLDPHKGLFLPYGTGSLLVKDGPALKRAHGLSAVYLPSAEDEGDLVDFSQMSPELSRELRGLRVWLPFKMHGAAPFRRNLEEKLQLTRWATDELRKIPGVEIVAEPQLSIVAFRLVRPGVGTEALNQLNRQALQLTNARNRVHLSGTVLDGNFVIRICVLSFRTHLDQVRMCLEDIREAVKSLAV